jgi:hypothetical protein
VGEWIGGSWTRKPEAKLSVPGYLRENVMRIATVVSWVRNPGRRRRGRRQRQAAPEAATPAPAPLKTAASFTVDQRSGRPLGGAVPGGRQGDPEPALHELPPGPARADPGRHLHPHNPPMGRRERPRRRRPAVLLVPRPANVPTWGDSIKSIPGDPKWALAPARWPGRASRWARSAPRSRIRPATAASTLAEIHHHMAEDHLVGWAWNPGAGRKPAPARRPVRRAHPGVDRHRRQVPEGLNATLCCFP